MLNLVPAIVAIEQEKSKLEYEFRKQIEPYEDSLKKLREINEACEHCGGKGKKLRSRACAEDDAPDPNDPRDWNTCIHCGGTGRASKREEK